MKELIDSQNYMIQKLMENKQINYNDIARVSLAIVKLAKENNMELILNAQNGLIKERK